MQTALPSVSSQRATAMGDFKPPRMLHNDGGQTSSILPPSTTNFAPVQPPHPVMIKTLNCTLKLLKVGV